MPRSSFNERWGIKVDSTKRMSMLKARINIAAGGERVDATKTEASLLAFALGVPINYVASVRGFTSEWYVYNEDLLNKANTIADFARTIEALMNNIAAFGNAGKLIADLVNDANCGLRIVKDKNAWVTYPAGEEMIDEEVVERTISFLEGESAKEFKRALQHYSDGNWEEAAEKTRRALEEYLRHVLKSKQGLKSLIQTLGKQLKPTDVPEHLRATLQKLLNDLDLHYNDSSKHNSLTYGDTEVEFLIYQVSVLMVLVDKIIPRS